MMIQGPLEYFLGKKVHSENQSLLNMEGQNLDIQIQA